MSIGKNVISLLLLGTVIVLIPGMVKGQDDKSSVRQVLSLADKYVSSYFEHFPELATIRGFPGADHSSISVPLPEAKEQWEVRVDSLYEQLQGVEVSHLYGSEVWITYNYLREELETVKRTRICHEELWDVDQVNGWQVGVSKLAELQPVGTDNHRKSALARFGQISKYTDVHIQNLRKGLNRGYSAPKENVKLVINQLDALLEYPLEQSPLFDPARRDSTPAFRKAFLLKIEESLNPAIRRYRDFLEQEYLPAARTQVSLSANPNGIDCYTAMLRKHTTLDFTPDDIHKLGKSVIDSIREQMKTIENAGAPTFNTGRQGMLEAAKAAVSRAYAEMPDWFGTLPKTEVTVVAMPQYLEASGPGGRYFSSTGGNSPARFQINLSRMRSQASLEKLTFHETIPGHHLQRAIALERTKAHPITRYFGYDAFNEGWGLYAEMLANEMGIYTSNRGLQVMLTSRLVNAHYLVLDTGLHALGWSRKQAINYLAKHMEGNINNMARMVDYIIISPGQTTSYMIGYQNIMQLRTLAKTKLGDAFQIKDFHDLLISNGSIPLHLLQENVEHWISSQ